MSQVLLEFYDKDDLNLLLSFAKRLNVNIISVKSDKKENTRESLILEMSKDALFQADISEITDDFKHIDKEQL
jgi:hypothetical protein